MLQSKMLLWWAVLLLQIDKLDDTGNNLQVKQELKIHRLLYTIVYQSNTCMNSKCIWISTAPWIIKSLSLVSWLAYIVSLCRDVYHGIYTSLVHVINFSHGCFLWSNGSTTIEKKLSHDFSMDNMEKISIKYWISLYTIECNNCL